MNKVKKEKQLAKLYNEADKLYKLRNEAARTNNIWEELQGTLNAVNRKIQRLVMDLYDN